MKVINTQEKEDEKGYIKIFNFDNTIQIDSLISLIKKFENDQVEMLECNCYTYDADDHRLYFACYSTDELKSVYVESPSPYFDFSIDFGSKETKNYLFSLSTSINSSSLIYEVDKKKLLNESQKSHINSRWGRVKSHKSVSWTIAKVNSSL